jgi:nitroimidazol reductase NimA-like FMN-containing flavoprotein (pyridoxamine 5'-phosphate oxidase superfamily)
MEIEEMASGEMHRLLERVGYGHLGCVRDGRPYVVPIHYAYEEPDIYIFTTEGMKTEFMDANAEVCLQVEEVSDSRHWQSVIVNGHAEKLSTPADTERAIELITKRNPTLTPAMSTMWIDAWGRANIVAIYRIHPHMVSGRKTV